jgi:hypothetical protein
MLKSFDLDAEMPGITDPEGRFRAFAAPGAAPGYKVGYVLTRGETHTTSWFAALPAALRFVYGTDRSVSPALSQPSRRRCLDLTRFCGRVADSFPQIATLRYFLDGS